jgi:Mn-dependent DtxR family transcriptional regulator
MIIQAIARRRLRRTILLENLIKTIEELGAGAEVQVRAVASELRLTPRLFNAALRKAADAGWITRTNGKLALTDLGRERSRQLTRAHLLWEQFLQTQVGLPPDHVHDAAEWIEHHLDEADVRKLDQVLGGRTDS